MPLEELRRGLYRCTAVHPDRTPEEGGPEGWDLAVSSYLYTSADGPVLFEPLVGGDDVCDALEALERAFHAPSAA